MLLASALVNRQYPTMALHFQIFGSSSSGNCALLMTENCKVLIDAGFSARQVCAFLESCGESIDRIDAIFLTHEHTDHSRGIGGLSRYGPLKVFANHGTASAVQYKLNRRVGWNLFETGRRFRYRDLEVTAFSIPHDANDPVGYVFRQCSSDKEPEAAAPSVALCTDLGHISHLVKERLREAQILVLEANYEPRLLDQDPRRPWSVKQRIKSRHGHLSNDDALEYLQTAENTSWQKVYLGHLSKDCNEVTLLQNRLANSPLHPENGGTIEVTVINPQNGLMPPHRI